LASHFYIAISDRVAQTAEKGPPMSDSIALELDIGRPAPLRFETKNHAITWMGREVEAWQWLNDARVRIVSPHVSFHQQILNLVQALATEINNFEGQSGQKEAVQNRAKQVYVDNRIPISTDPIFLLATIRIGRQTTEPRLQPSQRSLGG
jgi:hypothetical protein